MHFRSVHQLNRDLARWSESLPRDIDVVVGIPRSGLLAATMLALHMHKPLTDLEGLLEGRLLGGGKRLEETHGSAEGAIAAARRILVVDDSTNRGGAITEARAKVAADPALSDRLLWGAPYITPGTEHLLDLWYERVPQPRAFEWNVLHHSGLVDSCMDVDGVLAGADGGPGAEAPPRLVPASPVGWLVTSRPEAQRERTEAWLAEHGVRYQHLVMGTGVAASPEAAAAEKARVYRRTRAWLYIAADADEAQRVADASGRPVYSSDRRLMAYPGVPLGAPPRPADEAAWRAREQLRQQRRRLQHWRRRLLPAGQPGG